MKLLSEGAEAKIFKIDEKIIKKVRIEKQYRLKQLDLKLRKSRNRREFKILNKLKQLNVNVPKVIDIIEKPEEISFTMEYLEGKNLKNCLTKKTLFEAFKQIILIHKNEIVHGDLTTLNMINCKKNKIYIIDFGLSEFNSNIEMRAVDLNLFFTCIKNEHKDFYKYKNELLEIYSKEINKEVLIRLNNIEHRGRNK